MTITSITEQWAGETSSDDDDGARSYDRVYRVYSDLATESPIIVKSVLPSIGDPYPGDPEAVVVDRNVTRIPESREVWEATVTYEFNPEEPDEKPDDPTQEPAEFDWTSSLELEPMFKDRDGKAIVNSAGDYFDPPPEFDIARWEVEVKKNVSSLPLDVLSWPGGIISGAYTVDGVSVEANKSRIIALRRSSRKEKNDFTYYELTFTIKFYREEVEITALDQGFRYKDGTELKDILIADEDGVEQRPSSPVLLDGSGAVLTDPSPDTAVFQTFSPPVEEIDPTTIASLLV